MTAGRVRMSALDTLCSLMVIDEERYENQATDIEKGNADSCDSSDCPRAVRHAHGRTPVSGVAIAKCLRDREGLGTKVYDRHQRPKHWIVEDKYNIAPYDGHS